MAIYYCDGLQAGTGHAGTELDPWSTADFISWVSSHVSIGDTVKAKNTLTISSNAVNTSNFFTLDNWDGIPWRINLTGAAGTLTGFTIKNGIVTKTGGFILGINAPEIIDCIVLRGSGSLGLTTSIGIKGSIIQNATSIGFQGTIIDSVFDSTNIAANTSVCNNCVFSTAPVGTPTLNNCQTGWTPPTWPAWDDPKEDWDNELLAVGINIPPQPGNPPYTGYETDPWGNARTGIGAFYFPTPPPKFNAVFIPGENGYIVGETTQNVTTGQDTSPVEARANRGYDFLNWTGGYEGTENPLTITVTADSTTTANFVKSFARTKMLSAEYGKGINIDELDLKDGKFSPARYLRRGTYPKSVNFPE